MRKLILLCFLCSQPISAMDWIFCCFKARQRAQWLKKNIMADLQEFGFNFSNQQFDELPQDQKSYLVSFIRRCQTVQSFPHIKENALKKAHEFSEPFRTALAKLASGDDQKTDE